MLDLSIIIPIYNTPVRTLERCFASVLQLKGISFEVLLIDDGSGDETAKFCKEYVDAHPEFVLFSQKNGGVSAARNMGIEHAQGRYVMFVDSDDCLLSDQIVPEHLMSDADLVLYDINMIRTKKCFTWTALDSQAGAVERSVILRRYITTCALNGPYAKLFKTALLQSSGLRFDKNFVAGEDWLFGVDFVLQAEKIHYIPVSAYVYYRDGRNTLSRLRRFPDKSLENLIAMYQKKRRVLEEVFCDAPDLAALQGIASAMLIEKLFNCAAELWLFNQQTEARKTRIVQICQQADGYLLPTSSLKTRVKAWMLRHCWKGIYPVALLRCVYLKFK